VLRKLGFVEQPARVDIHRRGRVEPTVVFTRDR
jgi:hypothetical protein